MKRVETWPAASHYVACRVSKTITEIYPNNRNTDKTDN